MRLGWTAALLACLSVVPLSLEPALEEAAVAADLTEVPPVTQRPAPTLACVREPVTPPASAAPTASDPSCSEDPIFTGSRLRGSVCDERGRPVPGLAVEITFERPAHRSLARTDRFGEFACDAPARAARARVTAYPDGPWYVPPTVVAHHGGPLEWLLPCNRDGVKLDEHGRPWEGPHDASRGWPEVHLRVERTVRIRGRVLEPRTGRMRAAEGYTVRARWRHGRLGYRRAHEKTDEEGRFELLVPAGAADLEVGVPAVGLPRHMPLCGRARRYRESAHPGIAPRPVTPGGPELEFRLPPLHEVRGHAALEDGTPVVLPHPVIPPPAGGTGRMHVVRLDEDDVEFEECVQGRWSGDFVVHGLPPGRYVLMVVEGADEGRRPPVAGRCVVAVPGPPVEIVCRRAVTLEGTVRGQDVDGFWVTWIPDRLPVWGCAPAQSVGTDGAFRFERLIDEPGTVHVCREHDVRQAWMEGVLPSRGPLQIELTPGLEITGRLEGLQSTDGCTWHVEALHVAVDTYADVEPDGRFALTGLRPGSWDLTVYASCAPGESVVTARRRGVVAGSHIVIPAGP